MRTVILRIAVILLALLVSTPLSRVAVAQGDPQELLIKADQLIGDGEYTEGWAVLETLCQDYAGQIWDAEARMHKAYVLLMVRRQPAEGTAMLESIPADFPGTEVSLRARRELLDTWAARQSKFDSRSPLMAEYLRRLDIMIAELGGSPVESSRYQITPIATLDEEVQRYHLNDLYLSASSKLNSGAISGQFSNEQPDIEALKRAFQIDLKRFALFPESFDYNDTYSMYGDGQHILGLLGMGYEENDITPPTLVPLAPQPGATISDPRPRISYSIISGTVRQNPVDIGSLTFTLDGQPLENVQWELSANLEDKTAPFLTYTRSYQVPADLSPGIHRVKVGARELSGSEEPTVLEWEFTVNPTTGSGPTTETLPATKDALIDNFDPNGNEGANGILALDKLLGRGSRSLVAFDLSEVDTNRLSKATLVLSIHKKEKILGCGPGEKISVQALTNSWVEGNGKTYKVLPWTTRRRGNGSGATWNRDTDSNIANIVANGGYAWKGAQSATMPRTAPLVTARDDMQGTLQFDVTDDVLNGAPHGWLLRKQHENLASRISFYSKEGAVSAGNPDLAPKLILEYDGPTAHLNRGASAVASFLGFPRR